MASLRSGRARTRRAVEAFRATHVRFATAPFEAYARDPERQAGTRNQDNTAGACSCRSRKRCARSVCICRAAGRRTRLPRGASSTRLEQKEYLEPYVRGTDRTYRARTAPQLQDEFSRKLKEDPAFAASPPRAGIFLHRHPSWDSHANLYPIFRVDELRLRQARRGANTIVQVEKLLTPASRCGGSCRSARPRGARRLRARPTSELPPRVRCREQPSQLASDIKPLHGTIALDRGDWAWFGGALVAIGAAHHYDTQVRTHFIKTLVPRSELQGCAGRDSDRGRCSCDRGTRPHR